jgi:hypothetical protein
MNPEKQRIAIAEACGKNVEMYENGIERFLQFCYNSKIPDYLNDLNAMHDAEKMLEVEDNHAYGCYCIELYEKYGNTVSLAAAQRAEAFLRTLNLWKP